jgi:PKHD-type hydroxylase
MTKIYNNVKLRSSAIYSQIYWDNFFSNDKVDEIVKICQEKELKESTISNNALIDDKTRTSKVNFHNPNARNQWIFDRINSGIEDINKKFFQFDLYGYDFFQYSEYDGVKSGKYDFHIDMFMNDESLAHSLTRKLSLTLLLSDPGVDFEGGEFQINDSREEKAKTLEMKKGSLIAFPSFMIHRVKPVTKGIRKSLVIWVVGPKFK